ncbi:MAG: hypothetical protein IRY85_12350 [Micromonosporaceae bacterium]|nr:hypothetical protein [Micromonosporaceae bacterium]
MAERLTVGLVGDAVRSMDRLRQRTGLKKVDIINRALVIYDLIDEQVRSGGELRIVDANGQSQRVWII